MKTIVLFYLSFMIAPLLQASELDTASREHALQALKTGTNPAVASLTKSDVLLLQATLALKSGKPKDVLDILRLYKQGSDPLIDLLEAEAYRQSAMQAVSSAGDYAKTMQAQKKKLQQADLSSGLREADVRLGAFLDHLNISIGMPVDLLQVDASIYSVFIVDKARSRMFVYARNHDGVLKRVADEYIVTGSHLGDKQTRGDARTPNGVYRFVKQLKGKSLEARYGPVAYPIDYPNALDVLHHKSGGGIWMHGYAEGVDRRQPRDTKGCFSLENQRLQFVSEYVKLSKSLVLVGNNFAFNDEQASQALRTSVTQALQMWRESWSSLNTPEYLSFYHKNFHSGKRDLQAWKRYKKRVNASKAFIDIDISHLSLIRDATMWPEGEIVIAEFDQLYRSSNYQDRSHKRLYLARLDAQSPWRILIEETVEP